MTPVEAPGGQPGQQAAAAKKAGKDSKEAPKKLAKGEMEAKVLEYMQQQNRPYNAQNVFDNLHGVVPRGNVQTIMESLATSGQLILKEYGKIKVFLAKQDSGVDQAAQEADELQDSVTAAAAAVAQQRSRVEEFKRGVMEMKGRRAVVTEAAEVAAKAATLSLRASSLKREAEAGGLKVDEAEVARVESAFKVAHTAWRKRKRQCVEILRHLAEASGARLDQLMDNYGVDTDEAMGQIMPEMPDS